MKFFFTKNPAAPASDAKEFVLTGSQGDADLHNVSQNTLNQFIKYQKQKFSETGSCLKRILGSGRPKSVLGNKQIVKRCLKMFLNKDTPGQRSAALKLGINKQSVGNILKENGLFPYHKVREQSFTENHAKERVQFGKWLLKNLGSDGTKGKWLKFLNNDFSAYLRTQPRHNSKNHVVYAKQKSDIRAKLANKEQKFSPGVMLWGGISARGLVPSSAPLFVDEVLASWSREGAPVKTVNNIIYADMLETLVHPAVMELYPAVDCLFQDDKSQDSSH